MVNWEYSESIESQDIVSIKDKYQNFVNGKFQQPNSKKYIDTISPSSEEFLSKIVISNEKDVDKAVESAQMGFEKWANTTPYERSKPETINASRKRRIALGSGRSVFEVNTLLKKFFEMKKMMKKMNLNKTKFSTKKLLRNFR